MWSAPNIIREIKSYRMGVVGHAAYVEEMRNILVRTPEEKSTWRDLVVDGRIILN